MTAVGALERMDDTVSSPPRACDSCRSHPSAQSPQSITPFFGGILAVLFPVVASILGYADILLSYTLGLVFSTILPVLTARLLKQKPGGMVALGLCSYAILALVSLVVLQDSVRELGNPFSMRGDDDLYFRNAIELLEGSFPDLFTPFDILTASFGLINQIAGIRVELPVILPVNWMLAAGSVVLSAQVAARVSSQTPPDWLILATTLGNVTFLQTGVELFRDAFIAFLFLLMLAAGLQRRWGWITATFLVCFLVRGGSALLGLACACMVAFQERLHSKRHVLLMVVAMTVAALLTLTSASLLSRMAPWKTETSGELTEDFLSRREGLISEHESSDGSSTRSIVEMGWKGYPLRPVAFLLAPIRARPLYDNWLIANSGRLIYSSILRHFMIFWNLSIVLWVIVAPRLALGIYRGLTSDSLSWLVTTCVFLMVLCAISFVSYQDRHKTMFIVLLPTMISYADQRRRTTRQRTFIDIAAIVTAAILLFVNRSLLL